MINEAFDVMQRGGALMWVIGVVSIVALATAAERLYLMWFRWRLDLGPFVDHIIDLVEEQQVARALEVCAAESRHPFAAVARAGLMRMGSSERELERAMEAAALQACPAITQRSHYLFTLANAATLLGLLGTVLGLIDAFAGVSEVDAAAKQEVLSRGIGMAMLTTAFGLLVAIPSLLCGALLHSRERGLLVAVEAKATELLNYLSEKRPEGAQKSA